MELLSKYGISDRIILRNSNPAVLYAMAIKYEESAEITDVGALSLRSGAKTGRSPKDKRMVADVDTEKDIWWGDVNIKMDDKTFLINRQRAIDYFNTRTRLYVIDAIHNGTLVNAEFQKENIFQLSIPKTCGEVDATILNPRTAWTSIDEYETEARKLAQKFIENFRKYERESNNAIRSAGPIIRNTEHV